MQTNPNMDLIDFVAPFPVLDQNALHVGSGFYSGDRIMEAGEDRIPNRFDNAPALTLDNGKQNTVMAIDHRHVFDIALFFGVRSRAFDVAEQNGHGRAQLFQLLLGLRTRFQ